MASNSADKNLVEGCLDRFPGAWNQLVDENIQLIFHGIYQVGFRMGYRVTSEDVEDITSEVFLEILKDDFVFLRGYRGESKLSTYLCTLVHRKAAQEISKRVRYLNGNQGGSVSDHPSRVPTSGVVETNILREAISRLAMPERAMIGMFYLEGRSYKEISVSLGIAMNSIGPMLGRARLKLKGLLA
ncbi:MAG: sigma-70 family RNA polymerase sigma factor [Gemmataceae bacterium]|nr:sigma-70 family RNA polymerase sigma factor [Gemmataceae bacterium]MBJ7431152.1 sigma-70 family RNA polymerase sigma factor [Gemmataceae bacterium]